MRILYLRTPDTNSINSYSILSNPPLFSDGVLFVLRVASPRINLSLGPLFGGCGFVCRLFRSKLRLVSAGHS
jgi:hypothetical protein